VGEEALQRTARGAFRLHRSGSYHPGVAPEPEAFTVRVLVGGAALGGPYVCRGLATIGRSPDCDVPLADSEVSRVHARISWGGDGQLFIQDLGSRNGTYLGGRRLGQEPVAIGDHDSIQIGAAWLSIGRHNSVWTDTTAAAQGIALRTVLDRDRHVLQVDGASLDAPLVGHEYTLMEALTARAPAAVSSLELGDAIWGRDKWDQYMLHNLIARVRKKIGAQLGAGDSVIVNIPGAGYRVL
jgi:predicted component of type VI protein secretion system